MDDKISYIIEIDHDTHLYKFKKGWDYIVDTMYKRVENECTFGHGLRVYFKLIEGTPEYNQIVNQFEVSEGFLTTTTIDRWNDTKHQFDCSFAIQQVMKTYTPEGWLIGPWGPGKNQFGFWDMEKHNLTYGYKKTRADYINRKGIN